MNQKAIIGAVGLGYWGKNILRNLCELGVLHVACDSSSDILQERKKEFPFVRYTNTFEDLLTEQEIQAITIATPTATHFSLVSQALRAGKDVFVEKPLALTLEEGKELVALAKQYNRILMVGHVLQYHPAIITLHDLIRNGELGDIQYIYSNRLGLGILRTEENILWSFAPHDISVMQMLLNEKPVYVSAFGGNYVTKGIYDTMLTTLDFNKGVKGHIFVSWIHPYREQKFVVVGQKAMAVFDDLAEKKLLIYPHRIEVNQGSAPLVHKASAVVVPIDDKEPLNEELRHFLQCVYQRKKPKTDGEEGLRVLEVLDAAEKNLNHTHTHEK